MPTNNNNNNKITPGNNYEMDELNGDAPRSPIGSPLSPIRKRNEEEEGSCFQSAKSIRFVLPFTVAMLVAVVAAVTIALMAVNTNDAVNTVVNSLQSQVLTLAETRLTQQLQQVLEINTASAIEIGRQGLPLLPNSSHTQPTHAYVATVLDRVVNSFPLIDVHYVFYGNGRVVGALRNDNVSNLFAEERYPTGLYFYVYNKYDIASLPSLNYSAPALHLDTYVGYERPYFFNVNHAIKGDYAFYGPYSLAPLLLYTCSVVIHDSSNNFIGVMGADSYLATLELYFKELNPTPRTLIFIVDLNSELIISSAGNVLSAAGDRIKVQDAPNKVVAAAGKSIPSWGTISGRVKIAFEAEGEGWLLSVNRYSKLRADVLIAVATPEEEFSGTVNRATRDTIIICCVIAAVGLALIVALCILISVNLSELQKNLQGVARLDFDSETGCRDIEEGQGVFTELVNTNSSYRRLRKALSAFTHYVPAAVVHGILHGSIVATPGMKNTFAVVSFQDIQNFSMLAEAMDTAHLIRLVSNCFEKMSRKIMSSQFGTIDKFIGDCIMTIFAIGEHEKISDEEQTILCDTALDCMLYSYECADASDNVIIKLRTGVHGGQVLLGNFGSTDRFQYTVVGANVNTAARLEPLNKELKTDILASGDVVNRLSPDHYTHRHLRHLGKTQVVGSTAKLNVWSLSQKTYSPGELKFWNHDIVAAFSSGKFDLCIELIDQFVRMREKSSPGEHDLPAEELRAFCVQCQASPPAEEMYGLRLQRAK